ncbi:MAG: SpoIIE family protein phosphatase [Betaproteobacteria bacterium]|nr:SpoIIE family protein phosphatase [Betaproteobacteria bacterium]
MSIRFKILAIVVSLLALVCGSFVAYSIGTTDNYQRLRLDGLDRSVEFAAEEVNKSVARMEQNAIDLANAGSLFAAAESRSDKTVRELVVQNSSGFPGAVGGGLWYEPYRFRPDTERAAWYALAGEESDTVLIAHDFTDAHFDYRERSWYREIAASHPPPHTAVWSRPYFGILASTSLMTTVGAGMYDKEGQFIGLSSVDWGIQEVVAELSAIRPSEGSFVLLAVPGEDYILSNTRDPDHFGVGKSLRSLPWYSSIPRPAKEAKSPETPKSFFLDGAEYFSFSRPIDNGWLLIVAVPRNEIFLEIEERNTRFALIIGFSSVMILVLAWTLVSTLVNTPIRRLMTEVAQLGRGHLEARIHSGSRDEIGRLGASFNRMAKDLQHSIEENIREHSERDRIAGELDAAAIIQSGMLPHSFPPFPQHKEFDIHAAMTPAREVGGDFYDFFLIGENRLALIMADVSGKGVSAALFMVVARTLLKNNAQTGKDAATVLAAVNNLLCENNDAYMFVTAFMGILDIRSGEFSYANAGHNPPLWKRSGGDFSTLPVPPGLALAVRENTAYSLAAITLAPGDSLLLYTDGATETENRERQFFGLHRLIEAANRAKEASSCDLILAVEEAIARFAAGEEASDDITLLALRMADLARISLPACIDVLPRLQEFIGQILSEHGCPKEKGDKIFLAVEELFVNIAHYAYPENPGGEATLSVIVGDGEIALRLEDSGIPFNPLQVPEPDCEQPVETRPIGGMGIFMAKSLMDTMSYRHEEGKNILSFSKRFAPESRAGT